jgi:hypothetical protein
MRRLATNFTAHQILLSARAENTRPTGRIFAVSDDHPGLKRAIMEVLPEAYWQRCYVDFLRNALDYLPRKGGDDCLVELRWLYRRDVGEARRDLAAWLLRWQEKYPKLCAWVCTGETGSHAGESPAGRLRRFTTERDARNEAARPKPQAGHLLN